jgi:hypothetical protein
MKLLIAIPAYNEEESIESIIARSLEAKRHIIANSPVTEVDIAVVSDGSVDRTVERARRFAGQIRLIEFEKNRGYGAAIKEAWNQSDADLLGFLDADGTCDPNFFAPLCKRIDSDQADVVLGCRLNAESRMPVIRRVGNTIFAALLTVFSSARVRDTASGMRVVRRSSLPKLLPLPDGLHFTPAMSARAMLADGLRISEIDMPYHEREGESKLRVGKDGLRFLRVIVETAFLYRPARLLWMLSGICLGVAVGLMLMPAVHYAEHRSLTEWMIYRFVVSHLAGTTSLLLFCAGHLSGRMVAIALTGERRPRGGRGPVGRFFASWWFWTVPAIFSLVGGALVLTSFTELMRTGHTYEHWSRFIAMSFLLTSAVLLLVTRALDYILDLLENQVHYARSQE